MKNNKYLSFLNKNCVNFNEAKILIIFNKPSHSDERWYLNKLNSVYSEIKIIPNELRLVLDNTAPFEIGFQINFIKEIMGVRVYFLSGNKIIIEWNIIDTVLALTVFEIIFVSSYPFNDEGEFTFNEWKRFDKIDNEWYHNFLAFNKTNNKLEFYINEETYQEFLYYEFILEPIN